MRRKLYSILIGLLSIFLLAVAGACSKGGSEETGDVSITLSQTAIELDAYERVEISAEVENSTESVVWTVANPAVASVENGVIIAWIHLAHKRYPTACGIAPYILLTLQSIDALSYLQDRRSYRRIH